LTDLSFASLKAITSIKVKERIEKKGYKNTEKFSLLARTPKKIPQNAFPSFLALNLMKSIRFLVEKKI